MGAFNRTGRQGRAKNAKAVAQRVTENAQRVTEQASVRIESGCVLPQRAQRPRKEREEKLKGLKASVGFGCGWDSPQRRRARGVSNLIIL